MVAFRGPVAFGIAALFVVSLFWPLSLLSFWTLEPMISNVKITEETARLASTLFFEKMTALAQLTIALLGAAWALLMLKDASVEIRGWPVILCFVLVNLAFGISLAIYTYGYDYLVSAMFYWQAFDIEAPFILFVQRAQQGFFLEGCVLLAVTVILGRSWG